MTVAPVIEERAGCGPGARLAARFMRRVVRPLVERLPWSPFTLRFVPLLDLGAALLLPPRGTGVAAVKGLGCGAEWVRGPGVPTGSRRVILYFHGGGFVACGLRTHRRMIARISQAAGMPVLSVAYRMQPRVPIQTSIDDCVGAYRWLLRTYDADDIVIAGDSAGGYLAFMAPLHALREGLPRPAGIAALSPFADLDIAPKTAHANAALDPFIPAHRLWDMVRTCFPGAEPTDPWLSPVHADLTGLPPVLIQAGAIEVLLGDAELMAERLGAADVPCTLQIWEGQVHVFQVFADISREGLTAIKEIGAFARRVTTTSTPQKAA
ncbi:alpha/beta hydrolase [Actinomadura bangladeshensis]|jgi:acetyl esterase/lipase|uniref:Alpha/beta hydrolase n=1 Tax=Actinomadura bangladeshensis TaxID=453573 RepID=A0A6L9QWF5_9ACTN|nr:alpha/beta hydrolase [Actinomadura bangladeshensis]NEA29867.1 alpha/beta hydrolase [Actinomadura bangladeshensis]